MAFYVLQVLGYEDMGCELSTERGPVHTSLDSFTFTLSMCALYTSGLAMNAIPAESRASSASDLDFIVLQRSFHP